MPEPWFMDDTPSTTFPIYTRGNVGEVFPDPISPLAADYTWCGPGDPGLKDWMHDFSVERGELDPGQKIMFEIFGSYVWLNLSIARLAGARTPGMTPEQIDTAFFGNDSTLPPHRPLPNDENPAIVERCGAKLGWYMTTTELPIADEHMAAADAFVAARPDLSAIDDAALIARMRETLPLFRRIFCSHGDISNGCGFVIGALTAIATGFGKQGLDLRIAGGYGGVDSAEPSWAMWELSRLANASPEVSAAFDAGGPGLLDRLEAAGAPAAAFLTAFGAFVDRYGSRGPNEWELRSEVWGTRPEMVLTLVGLMRGAPDAESPTARHEASTARAAEALAELRATVAGVDEAAGTLEMAAAAAAAFLPARERCKTAIVKVIHEARLAARELGRRLAADGRLHDPRHVFMLRDADLEAAVAGTMADEAAHREAVYLEYAELEPPFFFVGEVPDPSTWPRRGSGAAPTPGTAGTVLAGIGGSAGSVTGTARIVRDPADPGDDFGPGDILVAPITDPAWTPLFVPAAGVVVDTGGTVSHAVIVCRELGIPCVVSAAGATGTIPDGALVAVDGDAGTVTILSV
jgi:phosphohistidine swiveling domain-containing protein